MRFVVADRATVEGGLAIAGPFALISIRDPGSPRLRITAHRNLVDVLELAFHDAEPVSNLTLPTDIVLMTLAHASEIWTFVGRWLGKTNVMVVQCEQGMSRSPAVAAALAQAHGGDVDFYFREYQPNVHVFGLVARVPAGSRPRTV
jgi:predicted protein tyrosine phosphatase